METSRFIFMYVMEVFELRKNITVKLSMIFFSNVQEVKIENKSGKIDVGSAKNEIQLFVPSNQIAGALKTDGFDMKRSAV